MSMSLPPCLPGEALDLSVLGVSLTTERRPQAYSTAVIACSCPAMEGMHLELILLPQLHPRRNTGTWSQMCRVQSVNSGFCVPRLNSFNNGIAVHVHPPQTHPWHCLFIFNPLTDTNTAMALLVRIAPSHTHPRTCGIACPCRRPSPTSMALLIHMPHHTRGIACSCPLSFLPAVTGFPWAA